MAMQLKPIYEDLPEEKSSPELEAKLVTKYGPTLSGLGADYAWCKKTWNLNQKNYSLNISPNGAKTFLMAPTTAAPLADPMNISQINGEPAQSGVLSIFWDAERNTTVGVLQLNLAPTPAQQVPGGPQVKPIPPSSFYIWLPTEKLDGDALKHLKKITAPPPPKS
ncbi:MAG TPA: hypothetical protein VL860_08945, partial [Planctomycetota bacterium]|nr:hypothetical protein [Planctomycetota bacterium]